MNIARLPVLVAALGLALLTGCATQVAPYDYTAFNKAKPASLLVMPPVNNSPEVKATQGVWAQAVAPLAEAGYYVLPVTLVDETFRQNGVTSGTDAQNIPVAKLREFFGADAAVYLKVNRYGTSYAVISSETTVAVEGQVVDLRTGETLWRGTAVASSTEENQQSQGGLVGLLVTAVVKQIVGTATDASYKYAGVANQRLLGAPRFNGVPPGPRSKLYGQPMPTR